MADESQGPFAAGIGVVWRHRSLLWWVFAVNVALGAMGALPAARQLHHAVRHSLAAGSLYRGFDLGMFYELTRVPEVSLLRFKNTSYLFAGLFAALMLFANGGLLVAYREDRGLGPADFFAACGSFFWRFVRLALISLVPFAFLGNAYLGVDKAADYLGDRVTADQVGFVIWLVGVIVLVLLTLLVRLWFDIAKVRAVAEDERRMVRSTLKAFDIARPQLPALLWMYLRISLVAWITLLVAFLIWTKLPPTAVWATFILLEVVVLVQLGTRLWQMASVTVWYKRYAADSARPEQPQPQLALYPETELPPADA